VEGTDSIDTFGPVVKWPEITFAVSQCARFTQNPRRSHEVALKE